MVALGSPQHDTRRAFGSEPQARGLDERARDAAAAVRLVDHDVVDEARFVAQLLPRQRLDAGVDVAHDLAGAIGHEHRGVGVAQLAAEKPGVAFLRVAARSQEALIVEGVMQPQQRRPQPAQRGHVCFGGRADAHVGCERVRHGTATCSSAPYSMLQSLSRAAQAMSVETSRVTVPANAWRPFTVTCTGLSKSITSGDRSSVNACTPRVFTSKALPLRVTSTRPDGLSRSKSDTRTGPLAVAGANSLTSASGESLGRFPSRSITSQRKRL